MKSRCCLALEIIFLLFAVSGMAEETGLGRTWAKLEQEKKLTIGYLGGSITQGAGASNASATSWRALTTAWFRAQFPQAQITEINAGIGGTGSDLGAFRCQRDIIDKRADLVFIEFAVNDQGAAAARAPYYEGIIRQIRKASQATDIILIYTVTKGGDIYPQGKIPPSVVSEHEIGLHYGLPEINVGQALSRLIQEGKGTWESMTRDGTHPNDEGYRIYADAVIASLQSHRTDAFKPAQSLPPPLIPNAVEEASMVDPWIAEGPGWTKDEQALSGGFPHRLSSNTPGSALTFRFRGTTVGLLWQIAPDSGQITYQIDNGPEREASSWDKHALKFTRTNYVLLSEGLSSGEHVLQIKVADKKDEASTGNWVRLGAFLVR